VRRGVEAAADLDEDAPGLQHGEATLARSEGAVDHPVVSLLLPGELATLVRCDNSVAGTLVALIRQQIASMPLISSANLGVPAVRQGRRRASIGRAPHPRLVCDRRRSISSRLTGERTLRCAPDGSQLTDQLVKSSRPSSDAFMVA
jgi:hypothetical protein